MSDTRNTGDAWVTAADGLRYWGRFGAAGLLAWDPQRGVLLQHRVDWSDHGGTWGIPGGARHEHESTLDAAKRESHEEAGVPLAATIPRFTHVLDRGGWSYTTVVAEVTTPFEAEITDAESHALAWVPVEEVVSYPLHPGFAASWQVLREVVGERSTVIVDAANVVGAVSDGWWKDRRAANQRLRDRVARLTTTGVPAGMLGLTQHEATGIAFAFPDWVLVTEGTARGIPSRAGVRVIDAPDLGDNAIVAEAHRLKESHHRVTVVTSDRELRARVEATGAITRGAQKLLRRLPVLDQE